MDSLKIDVTELSEETRRSVWKDLKQKLKDLDGDSPAKAHYQGLIRLLEEKYGFKAE